MRPITIALLFSLGVGVAGLSCYLGSSINSNNMPYIKVDCLPGTNYCYRLVTNVFNGVTYDYNCDYTHQCSSSGWQNTGTNSVSRKCCSSNYCNTNNSGASLGSIATVIASAVFVLKYTL